MERGRAQRVRAPSITASGCVIGAWAEGDTQSFRDGAQAPPACRGHCGKAITPPPDASFRKTTRAERRSSPKR